MMVRKAFGAAAACVVIVGATSGFAQTQDASAPRAEFQEIRGPVHDEWPTREADIAASRASAAKLGLSSGDRPLAAPPRTPRLAWPLAESNAARSFSGFGISNYVDRNSATPNQLQDYNCTARTYDLASGYNHQGIDIFTPPFRWTTMENQEVLAVAAMGGTVLQVRSGEFDRQCGAALGTNNAPANFVSVRQDDGLLALYLHLKQNSIPAGVTVGARVNTGDRLGVVGSSGNSTGPHLHFELLDDTNTVVDPMAGACNPGPSLWKHQWAFRDTRIFRLATTSATASFPEPCTTTETTNLKSNFVAGDPIQMRAYIRDVLVGLPVGFALIQPDGSTYSTGNFTPTNTEPLSSGFVSFSYPSLPSGLPTGVWRYRYTYNGESAEGAFTVGGAVAQSGPIFASTLPSSRSVQTGSPATFFATAINTGAQIARACVIQPAAPIDAAFVAQTTNPATNALTGTPNAAVDIPAGGSRSFFISLTPRAGATAYAVDLPLKFMCHNTDAAMIVRNLNTLKLSFEATPTADLIALAGTLQNDGVAHVAGANGTGVFVAAGTNIGAAAQLTVTPRKTNAGMPVNLTVCETVPATGACKTPPAASVVRTFPTGENTTWGVFLQGTGVIAFDPAGNRISLDFEDAGGISRGSTTVAARTD